MTNKSIRIALAVSGMKYWELAKLLGISEFTLSRRLRAELPEKDRTEILEVIKAHTEAGNED